jgi:hypothetical protein
MTGLLRQQCLRVCVEKLCGMMWCAPMWVHLIAGICSWNFWVLLEWFFNYMSFIDMSCFFGDKNLGIINGKLMHLSSKSPYFCGYFSSTTTKQNNFFRQKGFYLRQKKIASGI